MKFHPRTVRTTVASPLGPVILSASPDGLSGLFFDDQRHLPDMRAWAPAPAGHVLLTRAAEAVAAYFGGHGLRVDGLPLDLGSGTPFQQAVWRALLAIPSGATSTYGAVAAAVGRPTAFRAVGAAVGLNPISLIVPCHRVLAASGSLTGYAGGLHRKTALLRLEGLPL